MQDKVLIIEDSRSFSSLLKKVIVEQLGISCNIAATKSEAQNLIASKPNEYITAVVDLNLPDAPNGEASQLVISAGIPAIVFTSSDDQSVKDALWEKGISDYAHKSGSHSLEYICWIIKRIQKNSNVKILVVDDSLSARNRMTRLLKTQRYQVFVAASGEEAMNVFNTHPDITIAVLDGYMEGMDGFQVATALRAKRSRESLEIIGISSHRGRGISAKFMKTGANDFLLKPFLPEEFLCRVNHAAERVENFAELRQLNNTKNELLGAAAHDIRGPVGAIKTATDYILNRKPKPERQLTLLQMIETSASNLLDLLSDLLDVSAIESGELKLNLSEEDVSALVIERMNLYLALAEEKEIMIEPCFDFGIVAQIDPVKMRQVIDNLLTNAIKYSPLVGRIDVHLEKNANCVVLRVEDSGKGILEHERKDLFKPFKVLSSKATGGEKATGLGLAIAKNVVQAHSGTITYSESSLGGAAFTISLPNIS